MEYIVASPGGSNRVRSSSKPEDSNARDGDGGNGDNGDIGGELLRGKDEDEDGGDGSGEARRW